jgi:predicted nuclease of predicted toxin-antitoxin system
MRFLLDQSADARLVTHLRSLAHNAIRVGAEHPGGIPDRQVLSLAVAEQRILITDDRDFGELVFKEHLPHTGVIYLRLGDYAPLATKIARLDYVLTRYGDQLEQFITVTPHRVRVRIT